jgi:folate-binding protein YgfZ
MATLFPAGGWVDLSDRAKFRLTGGDRERFLQGQVSNDVRLVREDATLYACIMTVKGKMSADIFIRAQSEAYELDAAAELRESLAARLERYIIADDVTLTDVTDSESLVHVISPREVPDLPAEIAPHVSVVRSKRFARDGIDLFASRNLLEPLRAQLGNGELGPAETELLRISEGVPRWGLDLAEDTIPVEAGLEERAISYTKGCYIGQEVISRIKSVGRVNHHLCRLRANFPLRAGDRLERDGKSAGEITSAAALTGTDEWLALGYLRSGFEKVGQRLQLGACQVEVW